MSIVIDGTAIKCHKIILAACSNFFNTLFQNNDESHETVVLQGFKLRPMELLFEFMYKEENKERKV